jgi:iron complex outermembrane receptor protein
MNHLASMARGLAAKPRLLLLTSAAVVAIAPQALAQATASAPQVAPAQSETAVGEIVVTAQRREERLQSVPAAVTAFSGNQLQELHITGSKELTQVTPGLNFTQSVYSPQPTIRGIGSRGVNAGEESVVPIYIDGVYQSFLPGADLQFNDVERIEVLKGPQGALLGRNAEGGAINIITKTPTSTPHADLDVSYGSYNQVIAKGYVSGGTDKIAASLSGVVNRDDGYIRDLVTGAKYGQLGDVAVHGKVVIHPTDKIDLTIAAGHTNNADSTGEAFRNLNGDTIGAAIPGNIVPTAPYTTALSFRPFNKLLQTTASATVVFHFDAFDLTALTGYQNSKLKLGTDADVTPLNLVNYFYNQYSENEYNEIYATSKGGGAFSWIGGFVYYHDVSGNPPYININLDLPLSAPLDLQSDDQVVTNSYAAYAQGTYKFTDQWSVTFGGRYTTESKSFRNENGVNNIAASFTPLSNKATWSKFTPNGIIQYQPTSHLNFYAKAGQAFKSGVFNVGATSVLEAKPVAPETTTQYELGMKAEISSKLSVNLSTYYTDYANLQSAARTPTGQSFLQNAGRATIYGVEAEAFARPIDHLNVRVGISALQGTYGNFPNADVYFPAASAIPANCTGTGAVPAGNQEATCNVNGKTIMRTPTFTANIGGDYTVPMTTGDITLSSNIYFQGKSYWDAENVFEEKPYTLVDARIAWRSPDKHYGVSVWGENLANALYSITEVVGSFGTSQSLAKPRTYGVELTYDW